VPEPDANSPQVTGGIMPGAEPFVISGTGTDAGTGVLVLHGFTGSPASMRPWGEFLAEQGFTVRGPLLPGHGTRWQDANATTQEQWVQAVVTAFDELSAECERVFVAGLSMGGTLAIRLAQLRAGQVAGLILVNPSLLTQRLDAKLLPLLARLTPSWAPIANDIKKPGVTELAYPKLPTRAMMQLRQLWGVTRANLSLVTAPLLVFRSVEDHVVEPASVQVLLAGVRSTEKTEVLLEDSYHVATLDNDAPRIFRESVQWIREHVGAGEASRGAGTIPPEER